MLRLRTQHRTGGVLVLEAEGEVDAAETGRFAELVRSTLSSAVGRVVLDLSRVTLLSTTGVVVLTEAGHRALMRNVPLVLVTNNRHVDRVLSCLELADRFDYADSLEAALAPGAPTAQTGRIAPFLAGARKPSGTPTSTHRDEVLASATRDRRTRLRMSAHARAGSTYRATSRKRGRA